MAERTGLEPATPGVTGRGSTQHPCGLAADSYSKTRQKTAHFVQCAKILFQKSAAQNHGKTTPSRRARTRFNCWALRTKAANTSSAVRSELLCQPEWARANLDTLAPSRPVKRHKRRSDHKGSACRFQARLGDDAAGTSPWRGLCRRGLEALGPRRCGLVEREPVSVTSRHRFRGNRQARTNAVSQRFSYRKQAISPADTFERRVYMHVVAFCHISHRIDSLLQGVMAQQNLMHPPCASHFTGSASKYFGHHSVLVLSNTTFAIQGLGMKHRPTEKSIKRPAPLRSRQNRHPSKKSGTCTFFQSVCASPHGRQRWNPGNRPKRIKRETNLLIGWGVRGYVAKLLLKMARTVQKPAMTSLPQQPNVPLPANPGRERLLLSREEVADLTGTVQSARQRTWLDARGWPYVNAIGRGQHPRIARTVFDAKMLGKDPTRAAPQPRFDALGPSRRPA